MKMGSFYMPKFRQTRFLQAALFVFFAFLSNVTSAQVNIAGNQTATALAQKLVGTGVTISGATLNCAQNANGLFTVVTSNLGLDSGIVLTSGQATQAAGGQVAVFATTSNGTPGDPDLAALVGLQSFDACKLEFDFIPAGDTVKFDYTFGSEEYDSYSCSSVNDVFGFFISGPGYSVPTNIATIPGTTIPVSVNSTTNTAVTQPFDTTLCAAQGPGSPFSQYYVDNSAGTTISYYGFTTILQAIAAVTPCTTYHLKLAVSDAGDGILDSGVFLKAGSLTSNAVAVDPLGGGGLTDPVPYCIRGCLPGRFVFTRPAANVNPLTIHYIIDGDAVNGLDYATIADSIVIGAGNLSDTLIINALPVAGNIDEDTVRLLILSPYTCGSGQLNIIDTAELVIRDSFYVRVLSNDTAVCKYQSVDLLGEGDSLLTFTWTPAVWIDSPSVLTPTVSPEQTTTYTLSATLAGSGCPPATDNVTVTIKEEPQVDAGPDRIICLGTPVQFNVNVTPANQTYTYSWTPPTFLNNTNTANPIATATNDITYYIQVDPGAASCFGYDTVSIRVLPNDFSLFNKDTSICKGASVQINALGDPAFTYLWTPAVFVSDPNVINPTITPDTTQTYTITASYPGCTDIVKNITFDVQPNPVVYVGPDREVCQFDTLNIAGVVSPASYPYYTYSWTPATAVVDPTVPNAIFIGQTNTVPLTLTVKTPAGCVGSDALDVTVRPGNFGTLTPSDTAICPRDSVHFIADGGLSYAWSPAYGLDDSTIFNPVASPVSNTLYSVVVTNEFGCNDTLSSYVTVHPAAVLDLGPDVSIYPGESVQMNPVGNVLYYQWFPPAGLSNDAISNPVATPVVDTRYLVQAATENGCVIIDSIDVTVNPQSIVALPNAFTPGSQPNAELKILKRGIATLKSFRIFNRWGTVVFETTDIEKGWDGRFNGEPQPMGVYIYAIDAVTNTGKPFTKQGNITLIR